ncbi:MAG TPA: hypothetical protein VFE16_14400 [Candidatus Cybelea sp.]|jgi:hypothetical protein|nr:hypothetical protein [Candidatus Cybelea sp.]
MHVFTRRGILYLFALALAACSSGAGSNISPSATGFDSTSTQSSLDDVLDSAPEVSGGHAIIRPLSIHPDAKGPAILINFVANGPNQGGVPCIGCVSGASSNDTIGLTGPSSYVPKGAVWQYELSYTNLSYKGKCKLAWAITSGKKTIDSFSATLDLTTPGGFVLYALARNRPKYSGMATVTGKVTCGAAHPSLQAPIEFQ